MNLREFSDVVVQVLEVLGDEVVLQNPTTNSVFPCRVIQTPLERIDKSYDRQPIYSTFQILVEHWATKNRDAMYMVSLTDQELYKLNFIKTNTSNVIFDEITKKYRLISTYEVRYNYLTNSFSCTK